MLEIAIVLCIGTAQAAKEYFPIGEIEKHIKTVDFYTLCYEIFDDLQSLHFKNKAHGALKEDVVEMTNEYEFKFNNMQTEKLTERVFLNRRRKDLKDLGEMLGRIAIKYNITKDLSEYYRLAEKAQLKFGDYNFLMIELTGLM